MNADLAEAIEAAVTEKLERLEARRFAEAKTPRKSLNETDTTPRSTLGKTYSARTEEEEAARSRRPRSLTRWSGGTEAPELGRAPSAYATG